MYLYWGESSDLLRAPPVAHFRVVTRPRGAVPCSVQWYCFGHSWLRWGRCLCKTVLVWLTGSHRMAWCKSSTYRNSAWLCGPLGTWLHSRRQAAGERAKLPLPLPHRWHYCLSHPPPPSRSVEKLSSTKPVPGAKKIGDHWRRR